MGKIAKKQKRERSKPEWHRDLMDMNLHNAREIVKDKPGCYTNHRLPKSLHYDGDY